MKLLYKYNENGTFKEDYLVKSLDEVLIYSYEETQIIDGEEVIVENPLEEPVLPKGLTDIKPPSTMKVYPNISPIYNEESKSWYEDVEAVEKYLSSLPTPTKTKNEILQETVEALTMEITMMKLGGNK